jgi:hypothetical protein
MAWCQFACSNRSLSPLTFDSDIVPVQYVLVLVEDHDYYNQDHDYNHKPERTVEIPTGINPTVHTVLVIRYKVIVYCLSSLIAKKCLSTFAGTCAMQGTYYPANLHTDQIPVGQVKGYAFTFS